MALDELRKRQKYSKKPVNEPKLTFSFIYFIVPLPTINCFIP